MGVSFMGVSAVSVVSMVAVHRGGPLRAKSVNRCRKTEGPCGATYTCGERADPRGLAHLESGRAHPPIRCPFCTGPRNPGHRKRGSARSSSFASDPAPQAPRNALTDRTRASLALLVHPVTRREARCSHDRQARDTPPQGYRVQRVPMTELNSFREIDRRNQPFCGWFLQANLGPRCRISSFFPNRLPSISQWSKKVDEPHFFGALFPALRGRREAVWEK